MKQDGSLGSDQGVRRRRHASLPDNMGAPVYGTRIAPPFATVVAPMVWGCFTFDHNKLVPFIPEGLTLAPEAVCSICVLAVPVGWGIAPTSGGYLVVDLFGQDSPDTAEGYWKPISYAAPPGGALIGEHYGRWEAAEGHISQDGNLLHGVVRSRGHDIYRVTIRPYGPLAENISGIDHYISQSQTSDELISHLLSYTGSGRAAELVAVEITEHAPPVLQALRPKVLSWGQEVPFLAISQGTPRPLVPREPEADASRAALLALLDRHGRAACIVRRKGELVHMNEAARSLVGSEVNRRGGVIRVDSADDQQRLDAALEAAISRVGDSIPTHFALPRADGRKPLVLQVAPVDSVIAGAGTALVLITDPAEPHHAAPIETLQLLGLTWSEARAAALVGGGLAPLEAADRLGVAPSTLRSALRSVYDKLGISRQSELVQIVGRLAST